MKLSLLLMIHASILILSGIAFGLYAPLMMAFFDVAGSLEDSLSYWQVAAFVRMFGAALFGMGLLLLAVRSSIKNLSKSSRRDIISALLLANIMCAYVAITQQQIVWQGPAGWIITAIFAALILAYALAMFENREETGNPGIA